MMIPAFAEGLGKSGLHDTHDFAQITEVAWLDIDQGRFATIPRSWTPGHGLGGFRWLGVGLASIEGLG